jgi:hypothetical protein
MADSGDWPALPLAAWRETRDTLHMYTQIVGKIKLGLMPLERGWANVPLFLTPRGFTTGAMPYGERMVQIDFDFVAHTIELTTSDGGARSIALLPARCVADIYAAIMAALGALGVTVTIWPMTVEVPNPTRCDEDREHGSYDPEYVERFRRAMASIGTAFIEHRAPFRGRHSPLQFFWGTFDLAYVRFSGRDADPPPNADRMMRIAMDAQEIAAGFWPGDDRFPEPAFYAYAYPKPLGLEAATIQPAAAGWNASLGEFVLRYDDVRSAPSPRAALLDFLAATYDAAATRANWDRSLEGVSIPD